MVPLLRLDPVAHAPPGRVRERLRVYRAVAEGRATSRRDLAQLLGLRSSTVSVLVSELVEGGFLVETARAPGGRGRPALALLANAFRLGAVLIRAQSQAFHGQAVNLAGQTIREATVDVPAGAGNEEIALALCHLRDTLLPALPPGCRPAGLALSLSGVLDTPSRTWLFSSRWPRMQELALDAALGTSLPLVVGRNLDTELAARIEQEPRDGEAVLLLHWGYGIGASFACRGEIVNGARGRFCEVGHWRLGLGRGRPCRCGDTDCLETVAALWALAPALTDRFGPVPVEEAAFARLARELPLLGHEAVEQALEELVRVLANLCRLLFPQRIVVTGPFIANAALWQRFVERFGAMPKMRGLPVPVLAPGERSADLETAGTLRPLMTRTFLAAVQRPDTPVSGKPDAG